MVTHHFALTHMDGTLSQPDDHFLQVPRQTVSLSPRGKVGERRASCTAAASFLS